MPPARGSIHSNPRKDSKAAVLLRWARRRATWSAPKAGAACGISASRCRAMVRAFYEAGIIEQVDPYTNGGSGDGPSAATWRLTAAGRALEQAPVMIVENGVIKGARLPA